MVKAETEANILTTWLLSWSNLPIKTMSYTWDGRIYKMNYFMTVSPVVMAHLSVSHSPHLYTSNLEQTRQSSCKPPNQGSFECSPLMDEKHKAVTRWEEPLLRCVTNTRLPHRVGNPSAGKGASTTGRATRISNVILWGKHNQHGWFETAGESSGEQWAWSKGSKTWLTVKDRKNCNWLISRCEDSWVWSQFSKERSNLFSMPIMNKK